MAVNVLGIVGALAIILAFKLMPWCRYVGVSALFLSIFVVFFFLRNFQIL